MGLTTRPATAADYEFLYHLHKASMKEAIDQTWGWDESWQRNYFDDNFDPGKRQILQWQGQDIGTLSIRETKDELYLALIELLPQFQGRGWGTAVIQEFMQQAQRSNKIFSLHVLKKNRRAVALYERLGLEIVAIEKYKYKMRFASKQDPD